MDEELYHYGVKGMKWGIRRTPAQLGHKTGTKRKKSSNAAAETVKRGAKKVASAVSSRYATSKQKRLAKKLHDEEVKRTQSNKKKKISELTDDELRERIVRMELEQRYRNLSPQKQSAGKAFISKVGNQVVGPALTNVARDYLTKQLRKAAGLENTNVDPLKALRAEVDRLNLENKKGVLTDSINKRNREHEEAAKNKQQADKAAKNKQQTDNSDSNASGGSNNTASSARQTEQRNTSSQSSSYSNPSTSSGSRYVNDVIELTDYTIEDVPTRSALAGSDYVRGLLGPGSDDERRRR